MKIIADLHSHSTHSDGELAPEQLVDLAAERGVQVLALTDHDAVSGVPAAIERGHARGVEVIPGCELTAYEGSIELHILALFVDIGPNAPLAALLQKMQDARRTRALTMAAKLRAAGFALEDADILEAAGSAKSIGRPHVAAALVKRGHAPSVNAALVKFLLEGCVGYVPKYALTPENAFAAVRNSGGVALLAHPGSCPHDELITPLFRRGMDGVEAHYRGHAEMNRRFYAGLARRYEKVVSGGSDYHGPRVRPGVLPGDGGVDQPTLGALRRLAKTRQEVLNA